MRLFFSIKKVVCCGVLFDSSSSIIAFVANQTLQIGNTHEYTGRRQICCLSRASGVSVVVPGPSVVSVGFRLVRSWLFLQQWLLVPSCLSHVSGWLRSVEVFAVVPLGVSCCLSCRDVSEDTLWQVSTLERRQVAPPRHSTTSVRRVVHARLVLWRSGASGMGANAVDKQSPCFQCVIEVGRNTLQLSTCPVLQAQIQLSLSGFVSRSGFHCPDGLLYSFTLEPSSPCTEHPGPVSPRKVLAAEALWLTSRRKRSKSESPVISSRCLWHLCPAGPNPTSWKCFGCHSRLPSAQSFPQHLTSDQVGFQ